MNLINNKIQEGLREEIDKAIDESISGIIYNISNVFGGLLYGVKLANEKKPDGVGDIEKLVRIIVSTSHREGPEEESYPAYDEKQAKAILERLSATLREFGIEQSWNYGTMEFNKKQAKNKGKRQ